MLVWLTIHGLTSACLQGYPSSQKSSKVVGSHATMVLASEGFYVCPAPASRMSRVLNYPRNSEIGLTQQSGTCQVVRLKVQSPSCINPSVDICALLAAGFSALKFPTLSLHLKPAIF